MREDTAACVREMVDAVYRAESRRVFATLIRLLGDFDLAEEALHEAFRAALEQWPRDGVPAQSARLAGVGRPLQGHRRHPPARALRRSMRGRRRAGRAVADDTAAAGRRGHRGRPAAARSSPAAIRPCRRTRRWRSRCAKSAASRPRRSRSAFLSAAPTLAQRIVRAKAKIRDARIPYQVPAPAELPERLDSVLRVIYLVFNEGYSASSGAVADAARSVRRGDPTGTAAGRAAAGARGDRAAGADAAAGIAARRAHLADGRADPAGRPGPLALEPGSDRGGRGAGGTSARVAALRPVHAAGGDRGGARRGAAAPTPPTGARSSGSTTCCCAPSRRRWSS